MSRLFSISLRARVKLQRLPKRRTGYCTGNPSRYIAPRTSPRPLADSSWGRQMLRHQVECSFPSADTQRLLRQRPPEVFAPVVEPIHQRRAVSPLSSSAVTPSSRRGAHHQQKSRPQYGGPLQLRIPQRVQHISPRYFSRTKSSADIIRQSCFEAWVIATISFRLNLATMPGILKPEFSKIQIKELHPTFVAEVEGVDFTQPIPDDVFEEILAASAKVSRTSSWQATSLTKH